MFENYVGISHHLNQNSSETRGSGEYKIILIRDTKDVKQTYDGKRVDSLKML